MTGPLKRVAVRKPSDSMINADPDQWHYGPSFNPALVRQNHENFTHLLSQADIEISMDAR